MFLEILKKGQNRVQFLQTQFLMKYKLLILISSLLIACKTNKEIKVANNYAGLTSKIDSIITNHKFNGVVLVAHDSTNIYSKAIGYSDLENKTKLNLNDQFVIGSISKQITAVLLLRAFEKGSVELFDTIDRYLPQINKAWSSQITIHHLLTHTHGIVALDKPLAFKQGTQFQYSQLGYHLIAKILEKVYGNTFEKLSTELFEQYGLKNTFHPKNKIYQNLVKGYVENEGGQLEFTENSLYNYAAAGSFISSASDLIKWNTLLYSGKLINEQTLKLMQRQYATRIHPIFGTIEYGYGLLFKGGEQLIEIGALGYAPGFVSACYYYPQLQCNLVVLQNTANNLDDFTQTFMVHTKIMELMKSESLIQTDAAEGLSGK